ncbi:hypothetical protein KP509_28G039600 [Ceratopteris richardii]|uniref:Uncharacterized protein n=1 Tax=Ceratopteris richardii TaxID=49495 RepID=A0A8T2RBB8_CERRI|nr:hypothetical protein KP509_28G039600 [Ceratopteris richardii]
MPSTSRASSSSAPEEVDTAVACFFYHDHIAFNAARSPYFRDMVKKIGEYGPHYVPPSSENLRTILLEKEKKLVETACESIKKLWERNGVSLLVDGWTEWASAIEIVGLSNVVCIVADGEPANRIVGAIIQNLFPHIVVCFCMAHCLNNILKDIGNLDWILPPINEVYSLVSFINNYTMPEAPTSAGKHFRRLVDDATWWENISHIVDIVHQLFHLLKVVDSMEPCIGKVYEAMDHTIQSLKTLVKDNDRYEEIAAICVNRWNAYYSPLHAAAYMLDPEFQDKKQYADRLVPDSATRRVIRDQLSKYKTGKDASYACGDAQEDRLRVGPPLWWEDFGFDGPGLQQLAIRILSQACTTSCLEQLWSVYGYVSSKKRNKLGVQRASDLVFVSANLRMLRRTRCVEGDPFREWEVGQGLDQVANEEHEEVEAVDCIAENDTPHLDSP